MINWRIMCSLFLTVSRYSDTDETKHPYTALPLLLSLSCWDVVKNGDIPTKGCSIELSPIMCIPHYIAYLLYFKCIFLCACCLFLKGPFPKNGTESLIKCFMGKMKILRAVYFYTIGGANGSYFCSMDDVIF